MTNNISDVDSYKLPHYKDYVDGTETVYSYFEARKGAKFPTQKFVGLQYLLHQLAKPTTQAELNEAYQLSVEHGCPLNLEGWQYILDTYNGHLPVIIKALLEGTVAPVSTCLLTIENTDNKCAWLTNYCETALSRVWYPTSVATLSYYIKRMLRKYMEETSKDDMSLLDFQLHDFGSRSSSSRESSAIGGAAHLTNFLGTDTFSALKLLKDYYGATSAAGFSVVATEHSIMTSLGAAGEEELFLQLLEKHPTGILSLVIDSYNYRNFIKMSGRHKEKILARAGQTVFRPDSGEPIYTSMDVFLMLEEEFGTTVNSQGYRVLNSKVGMLWGDGIDMNGIDGILHNFQVNNISSSNIVFGMGGHLLQDPKRDDNRFAFKCSAQKRNGVWFDIMKNPLDTSKASKRGRLGVIWDAEGQLITVNQNDGRYSQEHDLLKPVFYNGHIVNNVTIDDLRRSW